MNQWWHKRRVYNRLLKYLRGNGGKIKGLQKECGRHKIPQPCKMTIEKALEGIAQCSDKLDKLRSVAYSKRREHLTLRLKLARKSENDKIVRGTERIMLREESVNTWGRLKTATCRPGSAAASRCSVINDKGQRVTISGEPNPSSIQLLTTLTSVTQVL